jgi:hypothetical protein
MAEQLGISDILASLGLATALTKFEPRSLRKIAGSNHAQRRNRLNDVIEEGVLDAVEEYELSLIIKQFATGPVTLLLGGTGYEGEKFVVTKVGVRQVNNDHPTLSLTLHTHPVKVATAAHNARKYTITLPSLDWGVTSLASVTGTIPDDVTGVTFEAVVDHKDELNREGTKWLLGTTHNCQVTETIEIAKSASVTPASGWTAEPTAENETHDQYATKTVKHHKFQAADA